MRGDDKVIDYLNRGLRAELTAVNQYWLHYRIFDDWGFLELGKKWREESIEEMRHADQFVKRILFLEGFPNMQKLDALRIGQTVEEIIDADLATEIDARALYLEAAAYCLSINDRVSEQLFEEIVKSEEHHIDFLETQEKVDTAAGRATLFAKAHGRAGFIEAQNSAAPAIPTTFHRLDQLLEREGFGRKPKSPSGRFFAKASSA